MDQYSVSCMYFLLKKLNVLNISHFRKQLSVASRTPDSSDTCCSTRTALCTMFLLILSVIVAGLAVFTYGLSKDVQDLKNRLGPGKCTTDTCLTPHLTLI